MSATNDKIKVAVRVRPFNKRELNLKTECVIAMEDNQTFLHTPEDKESHGPPKSFAFDHCFNSYLTLDDPSFANQETVFFSLGVDILTNAFDGYNACIFAYGQTGSGKSYSMMGSLDNQGIIPRLCNDLFERIATKGAEESDSWQAKVEVSYMEIYNEKVHDLLNPKTSSRQGLKVREHSVLGPYVDGLSQLAVISYQEIEDLMIEGNKSRTVASTNMNNESSRSHAVFSVILTQTLTDPESAFSGEKVSKVSLVDLAGSERAVKTGAVGERLKEGSNINKSLTTLGLVISKLADQASGKNKDKTFVPYRDSTLTWLLKDNLGGNSKTVMIATVSPAADNYEETLSTLRYADRAKRIVNHAVVNEDPNARIIRELRAEVDSLKEMLKHASQPEVLREKLCENEKLMKEISLTWEEKLLKTGQTQEDRRQALEKSGISIQSSGIKVEKDKYFLINLNSDPSLNELLVYYLKDRTLVGRAGDPSDPDIQLSGVGIQPEHCSIQLEGGGSLSLTPLSGARTCVNGEEVKSKTDLQSGDRILWGSNHFFRVNCPRNSNSDPTTPSVSFDWKMAQEEVMEADMSNDPIQTAIARLERQHEEDKQSALEKQRQEYEKHFQQLKSYMSPTTPYPPYVPYDPLMRSGGKVTPSTPSVMSRLEKWGQERDETFKRSLSKLREDIMRANGLAREANIFSEELGKSTRFSVTLQIPPQNLSPNRKRGTFVSEPAILVKWPGHGNQIWSVEKLDGKLIEIRSAMEESTDQLTFVEDPDEDPFYEGNVSHNLIGVANIYLSCLFSDVNFDYHTPIISQQGEVAGRLQVQIQRVGGAFPQDRFGHCETNSSDSSDNALEEDNSINVKVTIKQATGLPPSLSNFVFCMYSLWGEDPTVVPPSDPTESPELRRRDEDPSVVHFKFEHEREFAVPLCEEFIEHCGEGALSVEVYGHRSIGFGDQSMCDPEQQMAKARSLADRWSELTRKLQLEVEVQELSDTGEHTAVEVQPRSDVGTGGVFQLRQGQQRKMMIAIKPVQNSGTLPIICDSIVSVSVGSPVVRSKLQKTLDSYQEEDLNLLRKKWIEALGRRREYLDAQIKKYINKQNKTEVEIEREQSLVEQWVCLTEERNSVMVPSAGSGVPGAPADWEPPDGVEQHSPVLFLDLNADDLSTGYSETGEIPMFGSNSILPKEHGGKFFNLPIIRHFEDEVGVLCTWDSSIHDSLSLNKVTPANERAYLIVKTVVRLSHPAAMDLVLRKRICFNVYKRHSLTDKIRRKMGHTSSLAALGVIYEIVSNIPKASEELEDRESLAVMAASGLQDDETVDGETFIEKYTRGVSAVETILTLDRLRQSVAVKELQQAKTAKAKGTSLMAVTASGTLTGGALSSQFMRKTVSVPNFGNVMSNSLSLENISGLLRPSDSFMELNSDGAQSQSRGTNGTNSHGGGQSGGGSGTSSLMRHSISFSSALRSVGGGLSHGQISEGSELNTSTNGSTPFGLEPVLESSETDPNPACSSLDHGSSVHMSSGCHSESGMLASEDSEDRGGRALGTVASNENTNPAHRPTSLNLNFSLNTRLAALQQQHHLHQSNSLNGAKISPSMKKPTRLMSTLHEEDHNEGSEEATGESGEDESASEDGVCGGDRPGKGSQKHSCHSKAGLVDGLASKPNVQSCGERPSGTDNAEKPQVEDQRPTKVDNEGEATGQPAPSSQEPHRPDSGHPQHKASCSTTSSSQPPHNPKQPNHHHQQQHPQCTTKEPNSGSNSNEKTSLSSQGSNGPKSGAVEAQRLPTSRTLDSLNELQVTTTKTGTPSMVSSGYGSQAVSSNTLSSDDSMSLRSISVDDTPENEDHLGPAASTLVTSVLSTSTSTSAATHGQGSRELTHQLDQLQQRNNHNGLDLLSPPDVSITSISPGDETDTTVTQTPSSANITPCHHSVELEEQIRNTAVSADATATVVMRRNKRSAKSLHRSSYPSALSSHNDETHRVQSNRSSMVSSTSSGGSLDTPSLASCSNGSSSVCTPDVTVDLSSLPEWMHLGESVQVRPAYSCGVISFLGPTEFAQGIWVGIELDAPTGKNDGSVQGVRYFQCGPKKGVFVKPEKVQLDKRGRSLRRSTLGSPNDSSNQIMSGSLYQEKSSGAMGNSRRSISSHNLKAAAAGYGINSGKVPLPSQHQLSQPSNGGTSVPGGAMSPSNLIHNQKVSSVVCPGATTARTKSTSSNLSSSVAMKR